MCPEFLRCRGRSPENLLSKVTAAIVQSPAGIPRAARDSGEFRGSEPFDSDAKPRMTERKLAHRGKAHARKPPAIPIGDRSARRARRMEQARRAPC